MLTQRRWRVIGAACLAGSALMAIGGVSFQSLRTSLALFTAYWATFLILLLAAVYFALLDFRYIRVQHAMAERELYKEILGDESFRKSLRKGVEAAERRHN